MVFKKDLQTFKVQKHRKILPFWIENIIHAKFWAMQTINNIFGQLKIKMPIFLICIHVNEVNHLYKAQIQALGLAV